MARIAFIGLGHMGGGMAPNLAKAGHDVRAFDLSQDALEQAVAKGCTSAKSAAEACKDADAVGPCFRRQACRRSLSRVGLSSTPDRILMIFRHRRRPCQNFESEGAAAA